MAGLATAVMIGGTLLSAVGTVAGASSSAAAQRAQADATERQGNEEAAAAQREAVQRAKEANLVLSRQQAVAAASGGSATDTSVLNLMGDTAAQGQYNTASAVYEGKAAQAAASDQAAIDRMSARQTMMGGFIDAGSTLLSGLSSYLRYRPQNTYYGPGMPTLRYA